MSSTSPVDSSKVTRSPMRIGWVIASRIPAIPFASVWRAAKPTTRPSTAEEASSPVARRLTDGNCASASATPSRMIVAKISRRTSRRRVTATGESSPAPTAWLTRWPRLVSCRSTSWANSTDRIRVAAAVSSLRCSATNDVAMLKSTPGMAHQANQRALFGEALRAAWAPFWITRVAIAVVAVVATLAFGPAHGGIPKEHERHYDEPALTHPLGGALSPLARWDAVWYLRIADSG